MNSASVIAVVLFLAVMVMYVRRKKKLIKDKESDEKVRVPLSDDVQKVYYDNYEKLKKEEESSSDSAE